jgi:surfactin synthase thioesterase subunit
MIDQDWFVPLAADGGMRLYSFPHAGAGCAQLAGFARAVSHVGLSVWSANLPGRQSRLAEPPIVEFQPLVDALTEALLARTDSRPYAMFGYCSGALLAYGVLRGLVARGGPLPHRLVVASYEAPDIAQRPRRLHHLPSEALWRYLVETGGVPASLAVDPRMRRVAEPSIRADFAVLGGYRHEPGPALSVPITVCYGEQDVAERGALVGWRRHSSYPIDLRGLPGGHWLVDEACDELAEVVAASVFEALAGRSA